MTETISWRKKIKNMQILFFVLLIAAYFIYNNFSSIYKDYKWQKQELQTLEKKIPSLNNKISELKEKEFLIKKVKKNYKSFYKAYNKIVDKERNLNCYEKYIFTKNWLLWKNKKYNWLLVKCIDNNMNELDRIKYDHFIRKFSDEEIIKLAISFGIKKKKLQKFDVDQKAILGALDQNIFKSDKNPNMDMEKQLSFLSIWAPVLLDQKLGLYKASFSFSLKLDYKWFINLMKKLQNKIYYRWNLYFTISNISEFNIVNENEKQDITIQWNFYFTK